MGYTYWASKTDPSGGPFRRTETALGLVALAEYRDEDQPWRAALDETVTAEDFENFGYTKVEDPNA